MKQGLLLLEGEVWNVDLSPVVGREQAGKRPAIVISTNNYNVMPNALVILVPLTTTSKNLPHFLEIRPPEGGLDRVSYAICDQPRAVSVDRLIVKRGQVTPATLQTVRRLLSMFIGS
jgi:mRNA interferase MazF